MKLKEPKTLQQAIQVFSDPDNCLGYMVAKRWPDGVVCPTCGSRDVRFISTRRMWECKTQHARKQFSIRVGTIYEDSAIGLDKWLIAMWMIANCKNGVSSYELARTIGITQKSAWFLLHRIRKALQDESGGKLSGGVEVDETFIGGKARNMHKARRIKMRVREDNKGKVVVMGMLERGGKVKARVVPDRTKAFLDFNIRTHVERGSQLFTDEHSGYKDLAPDYDHEVINHAVQYVRGQVHTNGLENFWSLLKRGLHGTYVAVEPFHLFRYIDEQAFRYNNRGGKKENRISDFDRFSLATANVVNKRLTYAELIGRAGETPNLPAAF
jgi:hypothetical protein